MLKGGCFCGALRYEAEGAPFHLTNCHCSICRGTSGAPFVAWFSVARAQFRWVQGTARRCQSSSEATRSFCGDCGTQLAFESRKFEEEIDVTICSLDDPNSLQPEDHTFVRSRLRWVQLGDGLPEHRTSRFDE